MTDERCWYCGGHGYLERIVKGRGHGSLVKCVRCDGEGWTAQQTQPPAVAPES